MTKLDTGVRTRLKALLETVIDDKTKSSLLDDGVLPGQFLHDNRIRVVTHDFENADSEMILTPPVLFKPRPSRFLEDYPTNPDRIKDSLARKTVMHYMEYIEPSFQDCSASERLGIYPRQSASYLYGWAYGCGVPRDLPPGAVALFGIVGIKPVRYIFDFKAVTIDMSDTDIREGHGLYLGFDIFDSRQGQKYSSEVLEYDSEVYGIKPHIIVLGAQANFGHNQSMMFGELVLIIAAMRNRAYQPTVVDESDEEANIKDEGDLLFKEENRFPVSKFHQLGVQHERMLRLT